MFPFQNDVQVFGFIILLLIAMIPAKIASKKGYIEMYERGGISYNDFVAKKKSLEKNE